MFDSHQANHQYQAALGGLGRVGGGGGHVNSLPVSGHANQEKPQGRFTQQS